MDLNLTFRAFVVSAGLTFFIGCGSSETPVTSTDSDMLEGLLDSEEADEEAIDETDELAQNEMSNEDTREDDATESASKKNAGTRRSSSGRRKATSVSRSSDRSRSKDTAVLGDRLELRLKQGDRFPLIKTVEQTLMQKSNDSPAMAQTKLELTIIIDVEQVKKDGILLGVKYSKVVYEHDVNGQHMLYDSGNHQGEVPWDALPYAGMVNNGFSFWLGRDNKIREMVGYREFLERCVAEVPLDRREVLLSEISNRFGDDGVANFVDDSIGLLPYDASVDADAASRVAPGDVWIGERTLMQPIPIHMKSTYRLTAMDETSAEIDITGRISAGDAVGNDQKSRLRITGGHSLGRCIVDRSTGLPTDMNLTRFINMKIVTPDQREIVQEKQIVTTIRAFPEMRRPVAGQRENSGVRQASGDSSTGKYARPIPTSSVPGEPVEAIYPD